MSCLEVLELKASKYPRFILKANHHISREMRKGRRWGYLKKAIARLDMSLLANSFIAHI